MTYTRLFERLPRLASRAVRSSGFVALAIAATILLGIEPARAQTADTWKSVAIIGGSTAAGAYIGHKVAGPMGTLVGAGLGASAGYAIDQYRRQNQYNQYGYGGQGGGQGYYNNGSYPGNSGYYGGGYEDTAYRPGYPPGSYSSQYFGR